MAAIHRLWVHGWFTRPGKAQGKGGLALRRCPQALLRDLTTEDKAGMGHDPLGENVGGL